MLNQDKFNYLNNLFYKMDIITFFLKFNIDFASFISNSNEKHVYILILNEENYLLYILSNKFHTMTLFYYQIEIKRLIILFINLANIF